ncbi:hypothetical protein SODALDRAFT_377603 [Sodiomyces alkalinus F11]|uniref:Uncharacterized protein n=1 Tax=Sodiomyces alkalinus (strain CBS 110278 / VKM F-3762 / F11) TaxID=1314773 RepID=A0A3N2PYV3_SODAK|nr:hypothetical protein SODALDRAFT_377603 [Sodiomyces alkalinus F11]ROT39677.1 hypothetical protein SODALDRAFT_377603 [Sodiomyces alkalinus F11]
MSGQVTYGPVQRVRNREYSTASDGTQFKRRVRSDGRRTAWEPVSPPLEAEDPRLSLMLVLQKQAEGEPFHWSLFVAPEGKQGNVYQVKGDATFMRHDFVQNVRLLSSASYHTSYVLAQLEDGEEATVKWYAEAEAAPRAANRASVVENCQG